MIIMLNFAHFCNKIGMFDNRWIGMPSGNHKFHMFRF